MSTKKNAAYNVTYRMFSMLLPLVTAPYLSRVVGREGVGVYSYAWSISYVFCLIGMLGLENYGVRAIARVRDNRKELNRTFSEIYRMQLMVAGLTLAVWIGYVALIAGEERMISLHLTMMSVSCLVNIDWCLMGLDEFKSIALRNIAVKLIAAAAIFAFIRGPEDLWIYGFAWSLSTLVGCVLCWPKLYGRISFVRVPLKASLQHIFPSLVLFVSVMAVTVYRTMDKVMLGALAGMEANGLYENAEKIIYCLSGFISAIGTVMMPKITHMRERQQFKGIVRNMDITMQLIMCMTCAMAFGVASVAMRFAPLFYGGEFRESGTLMIPLAFTLPMIGFANVVRTQWVLPQNRDRIFVISVVCGALVNLVVNLLLIPRFQAMGAVIGTLFAEFTVPFVQFVILRKELPYKRFVTYTAEYCLIGSVMLLAVRLAGRVMPGGWIGLMALVAIGVIVYGAGCVLLWKLTKNTGVFRQLNKVKAMVLGRGRRGEKTA